MSLPVAATLQVGLYATWYGVDLSALRFVLALGGGILCLAAGSIWPALLLRWSWDAWLLLG